MNDNPLEIYEQIHAAVSPLHPTRWRRKKEMLKRFGLSTLALATALAVAAPAVSLARDRDDFRGRDFDRHERVEHRTYDRRDRDYDRDRGRFGFSLGYRSAPAPAANGYYDQYGNWHPYGYYDQWGNYHPY